MFDLFARVSGFERLCAVFGDVSVLQVMQALYVMISMLCTSGRRQHSRNMATRDQLDGTSDEHGLTHISTVDRSIEGGDSECSTITHESSSEDVNAERGSVTENRPEDGDPECSTITRESSSEDVNAERSSVTENRPEGGDPESSSLADKIGGISLSKGQDRSTLGDWNSLPPDFDALILAFCMFYDLFMARLVCRSFRDVIKRKTFQQARARLHPVECFLSPLVFYVTNGKWHMLGFEYEAQIWRKLPALEKPIPIPDMDLFKDFLVSGHGGLFCVNVGKPFEAEKIFVFNPLTGETTEIPHLEFSRHPVALNLHVTLTKNADVISSSYQIIAIGSAASGTENLSRKTEVYDSVEGKWELAGDVPGTDFSVNEHQSGVYCESENVVLIVGFMVNGSKGILAFDVGKRTWREDWLCPFFQYPGEDIASPVHFAIAQLVECSGVIYLFTEQEVGRNVTHCIDQLDLSSGGGFTWTRKVTRPRQAYRALLVYPEYTCVPVKENKLCIFNTIEKSGVVYNMLDDPINPDTYESISMPPPLEDGIVFHSLNPIGYAYEPSFGVSA